MRSLIATLVLILCHRPFTSAAESTNEPGPYDPSGDDLPTATRHTLRNVPLTNAALEYSHEPLSTTGCVTETIQDKPTATVAALGNCDLDARSAGSPAEAIGSFIGSFAHNLGVDPTYTTLYVPSNTAHTKP